MSNSDLDTTKVDELKSFIEEMKQKPGPLMPVMQKAQDIFGCLSFPVQELIATEMDIPMSDIYGVATFYSQFALEPKGEHIIVFVTDVTYTPATKEVDIKVAITNPKAGEAVMTTVKANVKKDATTISAAEITLPDGFTWAEGTEMDRQYDIATYVFPIKHIA